MLELGKKAAVGLQLNKAKKNSGLKQLEMLWPLYRRRLVPLRVFFRLHVYKAKKSGGHVKRHNKN